MKTVPMIDVKIQDWANDFRHRAETLAKRAGIGTIVETVALPFRGASPGTVVLQFSRKFPGRLIVGFHDRDLLVVNDLLYLDGGKKVAGFMKHGGVPS
jgi:hypothetical protein